MAFQWWWWCRRWWWSHLESLNTRFRDFHLARDEKPSSGLNFLHEVHSFAALMERLCPSDRVVGRITIELKREASTELETLKIFAREIGIWRSVKNLCFFLFFCFSEKLRVGHRSSHDLIFCLFCRRRLYILFSSDALIFDSLIFFGAGVLFRFLRIFFSIIHWLYQNGFRRKRFLLQKK